MQQPEHNTREQIFLATERLLAEGGLHNLSMHKIAREANISAGTIYLYFESKDKLLEQLAHWLFEQFSNVLQQQVDETQSYFEQYRTMWWNVWHYMRNNPIVVKSMTQYWSIPCFAELCLDEEARSYWTKFYQRGIADQQLCNLPAKILFSLSLKSAINLVMEHIYFNQEFSDSTLENVIERTWRAIQK